MMALVVIAAALALAAAAVVVVVVVYVHNGVVKIPILLSIVSVSRIIPKVVYGFG